MKEEKQELMQAIGQAGHSPIVLNAENGGSVLILPYGARILGLFAEDGENLLWANPSLRYPAMAREFFGKPEWRNTGGARTWISPERDIHIPNLSDPWNSYTVTESVDPGQFSAEVLQGEVRLSTSGVVTNYRTSEIADVHLQKTFRLLQNPLHQHPQREQLLDRVSYVGCEQVVSLRFSGEKAPSFCISLWDAINLPATGVIAVPTKGVVAPKDYFEATGASHLARNANGIFVLFDGKQRHKISLHISNLLYGRAAYLRTLGGGQSTLVVRNFVIEPSGDYIDTPWNALDMGYAVQCYNDGGLNGMFGELEYHSPAIGAATGRRECVDRAQLWGFQGPNDAIQQIFGELLGSTLSRATVRQQRQWRCL